MRNPDEIVENTPQGKRIRIIRLADGLEVHIASPKNLFTLIFLPIWSVLWTAGGIAAFWSLQSCKPQELLFILVWLCFWLVAEVFVAYAFLWMALGEERIFVGQGIFKMSKFVLRPVWEKSFPVADITNIRASGYFGSPFSRNASLAHWGLAGGNAAFEAQGTTHRFGIGLEEQDAIALVNVLRQKILGRI